MSTRPAILTHGHLPENRNHGGKKTTLADPTKAAAGAATSAVDLSDFVYGASDLSTRGPVPTVQQGQSITFHNLDAGSHKVWHSITACLAPCTASTGIAYPIADATVQFDSGQLGDAGPPTSGHGFVEHSCRPRPRHLHLLLSRAPVHAAFGASP